MKYKEAFYTMFKSTTMDNGTEFVDQKVLEASCLKAGRKKGQPAITLTLKAHGRGNNENANRLITSCNL